MWSSSHTVRYLLTLKEQIFFLATIKYMHNYLIQYVLLIIVNIRVELFNVKIM